MGTRLPQSQGDKDTPCTKQRDEDTLLHEGPSVFHRVSSRGDKDTSWFVSTQPLWGPSYCGSRSLTITVSFALTDADLLCLTVPDEGDVPSGSDHGLHKGEGLRLAGGRLFGSPRLGAAESRRSHPGITRGVDKGNCVNPGVPGEMRGSNRAWSYRGGASALGGSTSYVMKWKYICLNEALSYERQGCDYVAFYRNWQGEGKLLHRSAAFLET